MEILQISKSSALFMAGAEAPTHFRDSLGPAKAVPLLQNTTPALIARLKSRPVAKPEVQSRSSDHATRTVLPANSGLVPRRKRQQRNVPRLLDGAGQTALMRSANTGQPPRHNLASLGHELPQQLHVAVRNRVDLLGAELANLLAAEELATPAGPAAGPARTARA
jgi:hypothetical protein